MNAQSLPDDYLHNRICPICTAAPLAPGEEECSVCRDGPDPYRVIQETEPCKRCGEGESWTVKGPDGICIGQSWTGDDAECNAEEHAQELNRTYRRGFRTAEESLRSLLMELERSVSAFHAHDFGPAVAPEFRDMYAQVMAARRILGTN